MARRRQTKTSKRRRGRWITKARRLAIYWRDHCVCVYCSCTVVVGASMANPQAATLEHLKCWSKGGAKRDPKNLATCCARCNSTRGAMARSAFYLKLELEAAKVVSIEREIRNRKRRKLNYKASKALLAA